MPSSRNPQSFERLYDLMMAGAPTEERIFGEGFALRPNFIQFYKCKNILIEDVKLVRPPMWMLHPVLSENITIRNVTLSSKGAPNGDGCDPEACKDVLIEGWTGRHPHQSKLWIKGEGHREPVYAF